MDKPFRIIISAFVIVAAILAVVVGTSIRNLQQSRLSADWVNHTHAVISAVDAVDASLKQGEAAVLTYLHSDENSYQTKYRDAFAELAEQIEVLKALTAISPEDSTRVAELEAHLLNRAAAARALIAAHRAKDDPLVQELLTKDSDTSDLIAITQLAQQIRLHNTDLLHHRDQQAFRDEEATRATLYIGSALNLLILLGTFWFIRDDIQARRRAAQILETSNQELETRVQERTQALQESNQQLKIKNLEGRWTNQALTHQLRYNHLIIDAISDLVIVVTKASNISRINPAVTRRMGFEISELADQPLSDFVTLATTDDMPRRDAVHDAMQSGHDFANCAAEILTKSAQPLSAVLSVHPLRDNDKVVGGVVIIRVTEFV
ncbi:CHASE3 domain-containing protein [Synoicihabitans lomoniglobus]|uniref:CHASE3 domain-containing protein n=1 Tax=Synoicihabitans lomoniglobus TaxID=2909285 RepID=A0AAF0CPP0_9BACT|nr:CHASE3 domain-containing protein [Opitutaceae bacterium LMO-M01]WED65749.1 CHASE3 domain-containing protein [Opitutaceae bacterium LMO-M01]